MTINPGMLIFCLLDSAIAFLLVFFVSRAKFGGEKSMLARVISAILGTLVFIVHFGVLICLTQSLLQLVPPAKQSFMLRQLY